MPTSVVRRVKIRASFYFLHSPYMLHVASVSWCFSPAAVKEESFAAPCSSAESLSGWIWGASLRSSAEIPSQIRCQGSEGSWGWKGARHSEGTKHHWCSQRHFRPFFSREDSGDGQRAVSQGEVFPNEESLPADSQLLRGEQMWLSDSPSVLQWVLYSNYSIGNR